MPKVANAPQSPVYKARPRHHRMTLPPTPRPAPPRDPKATESDEGKD